ncbi:MAG: CHAT domain-containing protein [Bacteroidota bacterium]
MNPLAHISHLFFGCLFLLLLTGCTQAPPLDFDARLEARMKECPEGWRLWQAAKDSLNGANKKAADSLLMLSSRAFERAGHAGGMFMSLIDRTYQSKRRLSRSEFEQLITQTDSLLAGFDSCISVSATLARDFAIRHNAGQNIIEKIDFLLEADQVLSQLPPHQLSKVLLARVCGQLGEIYFFDAENYALAADYFERALILRKAMPPDLELSSDLISYGWVKTYLGEYDFARVVQEYNLAIRQKLLGENHLLVANVWNQIGKSYYEMEAFSLAEKAYRKAYSLAKENHEVPYYELSYLINLNTTLERTGKRHAAQEHYLLAQELIKRNQYSEGAAFYEQARTSYQNQAAFHINQSEFEQAEKYLSFAENFWHQKEKDQGNAFEPLEFASILRAEINWKRGRYLAARKAINQYFQLLNLDLSNGQLVSEHEYEPAVIIEAMLLKARIERMVAPQRALQIYTALFQYIQHTRWAYQLETDQLTTVKLVYQGLLEAISIALAQWKTNKTVDNQNLLFSLMEQTKSPILQQAIQTNDQDKPNRKAAIHFIPQDLDDHARLIHEMVDRAKTPSEELDDTTSRPLFTSSSQKLSDLQGQLTGSKDLLISYVAIGDSLLEMSCSSNSVQVRMHHYFSSLENQVNAFHHLIHHPETANRQDSMAKIGFELYQALIAPLIDHHFAAKNWPEVITLLPDGRLHQLPFALLQTELSGTTDFRQMPFLLHKTAINYGFSAALVQNGKNSQLKEEVLSSGLFFSTIPNLTQLSDLELSLSGSAADKASLLHGLTRRNFVEIITHGIEDSASGDPYILLNGQPRAIFASEISQLSLKTDLLVLAACKGAEGKVFAGEGKLSLLRAFRMAGCQHLISGMWNVHIASLKDILGRLHQNLIAGKRIPIALRDAKRASLQASGIADSDPALWAALISYSK